MLVITVLSGQAQVSLRLDPTFSTGLIEFPWGATDLYSSYVNSVYPLADGSVIAVGNMIYDYPSFDQWEYKIVRFNNDGTKDPTFYPWGSGSSIIPWGSQFYTGPYPRRRFMDGSIDPSFNPSQPGVSLYPYSFHVYPNGSVLVCGSNSPGNVLRLDSTGALDPTFQTHYTNQGFIGLTKLISQGRFILSGGFSSYDGQPSGRVIRIMPNGDLDTDFNTTAHWGYAMDCHETQSDGKLIVVGHFLFEGGSDTVQVVRLLPTGEVDTTFHNLHFAHDGPSYQYPRVLRIQPFLNIGYVITGSFNSIDGFQRSGIAMIDLNGHVIDDGLGEPGCGQVYADQLLKGGMVGIETAPDGSYYAYGNFYGYSDDQASGADLRGVIRLQLLLNVGEGEPMQQAAVELRPNPASDRVYLTGVNELHVVDVLDQLGRSVLSIEKMSHDGYIDVSHWRAGVYTVRITAPDRTSTVCRLVVQR